MWANGAGTGVTTIILMTQTTPKGLKKALKKFIAGEVGIQKFGNSLSMKNAA